MPLSSIPYGHALSFFFSRCVKLSHPVETPHKKRALSHLCAHRLCPASGMCALQRTILFWCPQVIQVEAWPDHAVISSQLHACPSFQRKPGYDGDELLIWAKTISLNTCLKKNPMSSISVNITLCHLRSTGEICDLTSNVTPSHPPQGVRYSQKVHPDAEPEKHLQVSKHRLGNTAFPAYPSLNQYASSASKP